MIMISTPVLLSPCSKRSSLFFIVAAVLLSLTTMLSLTGWTSVQALAPSHCFTLGVTRRDVLAKLSLVGPATLLTANPALAINNKDVDIDGDDTTDSSRKYPSKEEKRISAGASSLEAKKEEEKRKKEEEGEAKRIAEETKKRLAVGRIGMIGAL